MYQNKKLNKSYFRVPVCHTRRTGRFLHKQYVHDAATMSASSDRITARSPYLYSSWPASLLLCSKRCYTMIHKISAPKSLRARVPSPRNSGSTTTNPTFHPPATHTNGIPLDQPRNTKSMHLTHLTPSSTEVYSKLGSAIWLLHLIRATNK